MNKLAILLISAVLSSGGGFWYGWSERGEREAVKLLDQFERASRAAVELNNEISDLSAARERAEKAARLADDAYRAAVRAGRIRVSVPAARAADGSSSQPGEARAELDAEAALRIDAIAGEGDSAIRELNQCIDAYNEVREKVNKHGNTSKSF